jgi:2-polyprenyl-6-methoxyphenol hydroxylase-like FAD-dependent oxidoreductase
MARFGIPFRVIDKSDHPARYSQALVVQARTLEQWERYGIAGIAVERGRKLRRAGFISDGKRLVSFELDRIPGRYPFVLFLPQSETERLLTDHLATLDGHIERGIELTSLRQNGAEIEAALQNGNGTEETVKPRWVIGCDGAHSSVRNALNIPFTGEAISMSFFLGDLQLEGPDVPGDELRIYLRGGEVVFMGRLTETTYRVITAGQAPGSVSQPEEKRELTLADFQRRFDTLGIQLKALSSDWMTPFSVNDRQAEQMQVGNVFLGGDASHIHSPVGGQGMNTGIQDIANLAWKIGAVRRGANDDLLQTYEEERKPVGKALLDTTSRVLKAAAVRSPLAEHVRNAILSFAYHIPWVRQQVAGFISETAIEYRGSSAVEEHDKHGSLRAGDRVPNPTLQFQSGLSRPLLDGLKNGRHLAIAWNLTDPERVRTTLNGAEFNQLLRADLTSESATELEDLFGSKNELLIVRPDGYLGFRGSGSHPEQIEQYARKVAILSPG